MNLTNPLILPMNSMDTHALEAKWKSLMPDKVDTFKSLRITAESIPDLFIGIDSNNTRCLILKLPQSFACDVSSIQRENLSIEYYRKTNWLMLKLANSRFNDLFNDLILSLFDKIRLDSEPRSYTRMIIDTFFRWADFFEETNKIISDEIVRGAFGELSYLIWEVHNNSILSIDQILSAWQGPFGTRHDFIFPDLHVEVKTKFEHSSDIRISSEFQLQPQDGKNLKLVVTTILNDPSGFTISDLSRIVHGITTHRRGDFTIFLRALLQIGITPGNIKSLDHHRFHVSSMLGYDCMHPNFPKITQLNHPPAIHTVKYNLRLNDLDRFVINKYKIIDYGVI
jgi:Putative  PD-(D/E)XK family member, (DUF4420)